ncbi:TfpX/TfpZ family type IV pilin accessory protein [Pseudomonas sp. TMP9]|uniref:TfpX/TfpZ family type IV pilin accessory protein n=1 Tax=Pseudomonas sp. TMP9 TaxID=3133144 RepID=UPI0030D174BF
MALITRFHSAAAASGMHLLASLFVAVCCAALVFGLWYPFPYSDLAGGKELFFLVVAVDVVCGPLLTFLIFNPAKPRVELYVDIALIVLLQVGALAYGLFSIVEARPVFLAFEGDQFKVVSVPDVQFEDINSAPPSLRKFSLTGPVLIGVKLSSPSDSDYVDSIKLALNGLPPAFRPARWVDFDSQSEQVVKLAVPLAELRKKHPLKQNVIDEALVASGLSEGDLGYLPLTVSGRSDWVVIVSLVDGMPRLYLPLDGW